MSNGNKPFLSMPPLSKVQTGMQSQNPYDLLSMFGGGSMTAEARRLNQLDRQIANLQNFRRQSGPNLSSYIDLQLAESRRDAIEDKIRDNIITTQKNKAAKFAFKQQQALESDFLKTTLSNVKDIYGSPIANSPELVAIAGEFSKRYGNIASTLGSAGAVQAANKYMGQIHRYIDTHYDDAHRSDLSNTAKNLLSAFKSEIKSKYVKGVLDKSDVNVPLWMDGERNIINNFKKFLHTMYPDIKRDFTETDLFRWMNHGPTLVRFREETLDKFKNSIDTKYLRTNKVLRDNITDQVKDYLHSFSYPDGSKINMNDVNVKNLMESLYLATKDTGDKLDLHGSEFRKMLSSKLKQVIPAFEPRETTELWKEYKKLKTAESNFQIGENINNNNTKRDNIIRLHRLFNAKTDSPFMREYAQLSETDLYHMTYNGLKADTNNFYNNTISKLSDPDALITKHPFDKNVSVNNATRASIIKNLEEERDDLIKDLDATYKHVTQGTIESVGVGDITINEKGESIGGEVLSEQNIPRSENLNAEGLYKGGIVEGTPMSQTLPTILTSNEEDSYLNASLLGMQNKVELIGENTAGLEAYRKIYSRMKELNKKNSQDFKDQDIRNHVINKAVASAWKQMKAGWLNDGIPDTVEEKKREVIAIFSLLNQLPKHYGNFLGDEELSKIQDAVLDQDNVDPNDWHTHYKIMARYLNNIEETTGMVERELLGMDKEVPSGLAIFAKDIAKKIFNWGKKTGVTILRDIKSIPSNYGKIEYY